VGLYLGFFDHALGWLRVLRQCQVWCGRLFTRRQGESHLAFFPGFTARESDNWQCIGGVGNGLLYVGESTAMLSYPRANERGRYLGIWSAMRSSGSVIGGAINFGNNHEDGAAGGIKWSTYIVFIVFGKY
jgi:MFS family permease